MIRKAPIAPAKPAPVIEAKPSQPVAAPAPSNRTGRPKTGSAKERVTLYLDPQILEHYRATGEGWQARMNEALLKATDRTAND